MPKLPPKLVKSPTDLYDHPFRATGTAEAAAAPVLDEPPPGAAPAEGKGEGQEGKGDAAQGQAAEEALPSATVAELAPKSDARGKRAAEPAPELSHKFTVRLTDAQWRALHTECHRRRMVNGESLSVGELAREILGDGLKRTARRGPTTPPAAAS